MRRLVYTTTANRTLTELLNYLTIECGSVDAARPIVEKLRQQCRKLADLPVTLGRARPELGSGLRSFPFANHIIFFRYADDALVIVDLVHAHRDLDAIFDAPDN